MKYFGSPFSMYSNEIYRKILFSDNKIYFSGFQHGGGFGECKYYEADVFEKKFPDKYYNWGFGDNNIIQNRFKIIQRKFKVPKQIIFVSYGAYDSIDLFNSSLEEDAFDQAQEKRPMLFEDLKKIGNVYYAKHPREYAIKKFSNYYIKLDAVKDKDLSSSLFVLDFPFHTFLYKAIYQDLNFLMIFNEKLHKTFNKKYSDFMHELFKLNILYYRSNYEEFIFRIHQMVNEKKIPKENNHKIRDLIANG